MSINYEARDTGLVSEARDTGFTASGERPSVIRWQDRRSTSVSLGAWSPEDANTRVAASLPPYRLAASLPAWRLAFGHALVIP